MDGIPYMYNPPPPLPIQSLLHFNVGISQSPVIFNRDRGKEIMGGVDQTNTCLLTMIVVLLQNTFCLGLAPPREVVILTCQRS